MIKKEVITSEIKEEQILNSVSYSTIQIMYSELANVPFCVLGKAIRSLSYTKEIREHSTCNYSKISFGGFY